MKDRRVRFSKRCHALLPGYQLDFNKIVSSNPREGKANIVVDKNECVEGVLYDINNADLARLDYFEGYPEEYDRTTVRVLLDNQSEVEAVSYIALSNRTNKGLKPSKKYLSHLLAAEDILSKEYYKRLARYQTLD